MSNVCTFVLIHFGECRGRGRQESLSWASVPYERGVLIPSLAFSRTTHKKHTSLARTNYENQKRATALAQEKNTFPAPCPLHFIHSHTTLLYVSNSNQKLHTSLAFAISLSCCAFFAFEACATYGDRFNKTSTKNRNVSARLLVRDATTPSRRPHYRQHLVAG